MEKNNLNNDEMEEGDELNYFDEDFGCPVRKAHENEHSYILVKNKKTGNEYRIHGSDNIIDGPNGPWKAHLNWLLFQAGLKYKGPSSGEPILIDASEIKASKYWELIEIVTPYYPPNVRF